MAFNAEKSIFVFHFLFWCYVNHTANAATVFIFSFSFHHELINLSLYTLCTNSHITVCAMTNLLYVILGHSRTIVGVEELKDKSTRLLIFDPSARKKQMQLFHSIVNANLMRTLRKPLENLKAKQYQIVVVLGVLTETEYKVSTVNRCKSTSLHSCSDFLGT